jgi:nucleotide-binding universal stress UspA family protein
LAHSQRATTESDARTMYHSLLVPLDRSSLAEQALPLALTIARRANARLDLVEVHAQYALEDSTAGWLPFEPDRDAEWKSQEQLYLAATAKWLTSLSPVSVTATILPGSTVLPATVADSVLDRARTGKADLIVMTTHGRGPLSNFGVGSVADELIRRAGLPILLVRSSQKAPEIVPEPVLDNILIPLDGSAMAEQVLEPALDLALLMEARCTLLEVIETRSSPDESGVRDSPEKTKAEAYLVRVAARVNEQGVQVHTRVVVAHHAVEAILEEARAQGSNVIAMATHGRGGLKRLLLGSVADKVIRGASIPVLVLRSPTT